MKKLIKKNLKTIIIAFISLLILIIGSFEIGLAQTFLLVLLLNGIIIVLSKPKKKKKSKKDIFKNLVIVCFCCLIMALTLGIGFCLYIMISSEEFKEENLYNKDATIIYDINGEEISKLGVEIRQSVTYDELSQSLIDAIVATEDSRFFQHSGVDLPRFLKASINQVIGRGGGGASTLTMQISKNDFTSTEDSGIQGIIRKFKDIYISVFQIERKYTKEEIIEFYVNSYYLGGDSTGVEQASLRYFNKHASELNVAEAAMIAGLFQAPVGYDPYLHPEACEERRQTVLNLMLRHEYITEEEYNIAKTLDVSKLLVETEQETNEYQDFIDTLIDDIYSREKIDIYSTPCKIYTTMDKSMQENMKKIMDGEVFNWKDDYMQTGTVIIDVNTGEVRAVGAGRNRVLRGNNYATSIKRQIGSTAKPLYDYGPGIEYYNWSTYTTFVDEPHTYSDGTKLKNFDKEYDGLTTLHDALKYSRNIPAVKAFQQIDNNKIKEFVNNLGLHPQLLSNGYITEAHSIGGYTGESPMNVAAAYAAFSNGGYYIEPHTYTKIILTEKNETIDIKPVKRKVMSEETAYMVTKVLEDTSGYAVGSIGVNYAAKTGTTNLEWSTIKDYGLSSNAINDKWIASFNDTYAIAVWIGYDELNKDHHLVGNDSTYVKKVFKAVAKSAYTKNSSWDMPNGVVAVEVEKGLPTAMLASEYTPKDLKVKAYFKKGFEPTETSTRFSKLNDVTNLNYDDMTRTLSWTGIETPNFIDTNYLNQLYSNLYNDEETLQKDLEKIVNYNNTNIGTLTYDIYIKDSAGNLTLIGTTDETSYQYTVSVPTTFVVKSSYTIFKDNSSNGTEFTVNPSSSVISTELNSNSIIDIPLNGTYIEPNKPVIVLENGITDVTDSCDITYTITKNSDNSIINSFDDIDTTSIGSYTIKYKINYRTYTNTLTKIINIIE